MSTRREYCNIDEHFRFPKHDFFDDFEDCDAAGKVACTTLLFECLEWRQELFTIEYFCLQRKK